MKATLKKLLLILILPLFVASCSRKPDEELPEKLGDLLVEFKIIDTFNLVKVDNDSIEENDSTWIKISILNDNDTTQNNVLWDVRLFVATDKARSYLFKDIGARSTNYYLELKIDRRDSVDKTCPERFAAFVVENIVTSTGIIELDYRLAQMNCNR